ncbi:MAG: futalosine hydrolase [Deltaproteobacteria bacterium RIFOXYD12_FULL_57_12]|nr:MAG: futalosine hydrolase [Deltaproteobacteria bacterium RIFOXYD12_FULL_57_12]
MFLVVAATEMEMEPILGKLGTAGIGMKYMVSGMGPVETTLRLTMYLAAHAGRIDGVINLGVGGAYPGSGPGLLDICLAQSETFGDLGVCTADGISRFAAADLPLHYEFPLENALGQQAEMVLAARGIPYGKGGFVTVSCVSGTEKRGNYLRDRHSAICENMEGAAVARVCTEFDLPVLEIRCISNWVEERDTTRWQLAAACARCGDVACMLLPGLMAWEEAR